MDDVVDVEVEADFDQNHVKTDSNPNLRHSIDSPLETKSRSSSSEYEIVSDITIEECSDNEELVRELDEELTLAGKNIINNAETDEENKTIQADGPSDCSSAMEDVYEVVDDDVVEEKTKEPTCESVGKEHVLSDDDDFVMDEIIAEFAEEEKKKQSVVKLSDIEDEIDNLVDEFVDTENDVKDNKPETSVILSSDDEDEMECLLEEFSKENAFDDDSASKKQLSDVPEKNDFSQSDTNFLSDSKITTLDSLNANNTSQPPSGVNQKEVIDIDIDTKSDCSSVEILISDDEADNNNEKIMKDTDKVVAIEEPIIDDRKSESQKINFNDMIIVNEVQDNSDIEIGKLITEAGDSLSNPVKSSPQILESFVFLNSESNSNNSMTVYSSLNAKNLELGSNEQNNLSENKSIINADDSHKTINSSDVDSITITDDCSKSCTDNNLPNDIINVISVADKVSKLSADINIPCGSNVVSFDDTCPKFSDDIKSHDISSVITTTDKSSKLPINILDINSLRAIVDTFLKSSEVTKNLNESTAVFSNIEIPHLATSVVESIVDSPETQTDTNNKEKITISTDTKEGRVYVETLIKCKQSINI